MNSDGEVIERARARWEVQGGIDASSFPQLLAIAENCHRVKNTLYDVVRCSENGTYADKSCSINRARKLLAELDGMRRINADALLETSG